MKRVLVNGTGDIAMMGTAFSDYAVRGSSLPCVDFDIQRLLSWLHGEVLERVTIE